MRYFAGALNSRLVLSCGGAAVVATALIGRWNKIKVSDRSLQEEQCEFQWRDVEFAATTGERLNIPSNF